LYTGIIFLKRNNWEKHKG